MQTTSDPTVSNSTSPSSDDVLAEAMALIKRGCEMIAAIDGGSEDAKRLRPAVVLLKEASTIIKTVPDAGDSGMLRWRIYETIQAQEGNDNAALYKELRCSIHLGLAGECSDPVTLPCGHSFCKTCIAPFYSATMSVSQRKCPQCRVPFTVSYDSLKTNVAIKGVTDHLLPLGTQHDAAAIAAAEAAVVRTTAGAASSSGYGGGGYGGGGYGGGGYGGGYGGGGYGYGYHH